MILSRYNLWEMSKLPVNEDVIEDVFHQTTVAIFFFHFFLLNNALKFKGSLVFVINLNDKFQ